MSSHLDAFIAEETPHIRRELQDFFAAKKSEALQVNQHLNESVFHIAEFVLRGGKSLRPLLMVLGYRLAGGSRSSEIYRVAAGIEVSHKYLLNVDDIADRDEQRNGGPTVWRFYEDAFRKLGWKDAAHHGRTFAEIDGVVMASFVTELIRTAQFPPEILLQVLGVVDHTMYWETIAGWQIHYFQNDQLRSEAKEKEFLRGLELVTAQYSFVAPLTIGAILAGRGDDAQLLDMLQQYGRAVGRAFQIHDDILGVFGDSGKTGKPVGNDIREGKKTLLLLKAFQNGSAVQKKFLVDVCGRELQSGELEKVQSIIRETGSLEYSEKLAKKSVEEGIKVLESLKDSEEKQILKELAGFVVSREN